jgi:hypothetical protein
MLAVDIAQGMVEREIEMGIYSRCKAGPADSSIFDVENGSCIATDMAKSVRLDDGKKYRGVYFTKADKSPGSRKTGWEQMRKMFNQALRKHGRPRELPGIFIFNTCLNFIRTVPVLPRDEKKMDDVNTDAEDHIGDETRYRVRTFGNRASSGTTIGHY